MSLALFFILLGAGCTKGSPPPAPGPEAPAASGPAQDVISSFTLMGNDRTGRKKWEIEGQTANLLAETVLLSPVTAKSFGKAQTTLTAARGKFQKQSRDVELKEDVIAVTSDGARLSTDTFFWSADRGMGRTSDWVTITRPGMVVAGKGGIGFPSLKKVKLEKEITVTLTGAKGKTVITCDGPMETDYGRGRIRFLKKVVVRDAQGTIHSDRMDVALDPKTNQIRRITCLGDVVIRQADRVSYADRADYWQPRGDVRLMGHPRIVWVGNPHES
jgi:LPS export ABC transporter protein LptC